MGLFSGEKDFFGLDIGSSCIRLVQLRRSAGRYSLVSYGSANIPIGLSQSDSTLDIKQLSEVVKRLVADCKTSTKKVVVSLPGSSVFTTVVKMPQMSESEIANAVKWQAEQNIPLKIDEVKLDWQLINSSLENSKQMAVLIIAAPNEKIERLMKISETAGLKVLAIETVPIALSRSLGQGAGSKTMVVDIGAVTTEIAIVENGLLYHSRSLQIAGFAFTRAISQNLGVDSNQAEQFKRKFGLAEEKLAGEIFKSLEPLLSGIVEEIRRLIKFYQEEFGGTLGKIILSGGGAKLPEISQYFSKVLDLNVQIGAPWADISYPPSSQQHILDTNAEYATAIGLAKRS